MNSKITEIIVSESEKGELKDSGVDKGRRDFVIKASYSTPTLIALGFAAHSSKVGAQGPPSPPAFDTTTSGLEAVLRELEEIEAGKAAKSDGGG